MTKRDGMRIGVCLKIFTGMLLLLLAVNWAQRLIAQTENWQTYTYSTDGFSISFPAAPTTNSQKVATEKGSTELRSYLSLIGNSALYVGVCDYGTVANGKDPNAVLQAAKKGAVDNMKAHITSEMNITLGIYPGLSFEAENETLHFSARIYFVGTTLYQDLAASPLKESYGGTARFLNSFQLIARTH